MFDPNYGTMSDDDLLMLGKAAGYIPEQPTQDPGYIDMESPDPATADVPDTRQDYHSWVPGVNQPTPQVPPTRQSQSFGTSSSSRGFSEDKYNQVARTKTGLGADLAAADATALAGGQPMADAAAGAHASGVDAAKAQAGALVGKIKGEGEQALVMQRLQDDFASEEAKINAEASASSNQAKSDYLAALADFRGAKVDPSQLWQNMSGGERFGTLMSAFVHDFLGARGINTSAMSTINKAIDRNIDSQVQAIRTKGEVAEGFKSLWYMQRNQSASETEARARVRGFMLEGAKQAVISNMAQYESALASAQGKAAIAKIDEEFSKNLIDIYKHVDQNAIARRNQAISIWQTNVNAALESQANSIRQQEASTHARQVDKVEKAPGPDLIFDPESGHAIGYFKPGIEKEEKIKARSAFEDSMVTAKNLSLLRDLTRNSKAVDIWGTSRFQPTDQQKFDALAVKLAHQMVKSFGEKATDPDVKQMMQGLRPNSYMNRADAEKVIAFMQARVIEPAQATYANLAYELPTAGPGAEYRQLSNANPASMMGGALSEATNTSEPPPPTTTEIHREAALTGAAGIGGTPVLNKEDISGDLETAHKLAATQRPDLFGGEAEKTQATAEGPIGAASTRLNKMAHGQGEAAVPVRKFEKKMVELRRLARGGDQVSLEALQQAAGPYINAGQSDDKEAVFAAIMLQTLGDEE